MSIAYGGRFVQGRAGTIRGNRSAEFIAAKSLILPQVELGESLAARTESLCQ